MIQLDKKGLLVMTYLRLNARESLTTLSRKTAIPVSTIYDKLKLYKDHFIIKYTTLINFARLGFNARANILLKADRDSRQALREYLINHYHVNSVYKISNGYDFLVEGIFRNVKEVEDFLDILGDKFTIEETAVYYIVEDLKKETFLNDKNLLDVVAA